MPRDFVARLTFMYDCSADSHRIVNELAEGEGVCKEGNTTAESLLQGWAADQSLACADMLAN